LIESVLSRKGLAIEDLNIELIEKVKSNSSRPDYTLKLSNPFFLQDYQTDLLGGQYYDLEPMQDLLNKIISDNDLGFPIQQFVTDDTSFLFFWGDLIALNKILVKLGLATEDDLRVANERRLRKAEAKAKEEKRRREIELKKAEQKKREKLLAATKIKVYTKTKNYHELIHEYNKAAEYPDEIRFEIIQGLREDTSERNYELMLGEVANYSGNASWYALQVLRITFGKSDKFLSQLIENNLLKTQDYRFFMKQFVHLEYLKDSSSLPEVDKILQALAKPAFKNKSYHQSEEIVPILVKTFDKDWIAKLRPYLKSESSGLVYLISHTLSLVIMWDWQDNEKLWKEIVLEAIDHSHQGKIRFKAYSSLIQQYIAKYKDKELIFSLLNHPIDKHSSDRLATFNNYYYRHGFLPEVEEKYLEIAERLLQENKPIQLKPLITGFSFSENPKVKAMMKRIEDKYFSSYEYIFKVESQEEYDRNLQFGIDYGKKIKPKNGGFMAGLFNFFNS